MIAAVNGINADSNYWNGLGQQLLREELAKQRIDAQAKNIVFFLGDGMSIPTITASRIYKGQKEGRTGEESQLEFDKFPYAALSRVSFQLRPTTQVMPNFLFHLDVLRWCASCWFSLFSNSLPGRYKSQRWHERCRCQRTSQRLRGTKEWGLSREIGDGLGSGNGGKSLKISTKEDYWIENRTVNFRKLGKEQASSRPLEWRTPLLHHRMPTVLTVTGKTMSPWWRREVTLRNAKTLPDSWLKTEQEASLKWSWVAGERIFFPTPPPMWKEDTVAVETVGISSAFGKPIIQMDITSLIGTGFWPWTWIQWIRCWVRWISLPWL